VVPKESCVGVLRAVSGLRGSQDLHHVEAFGLVDRDDRTEDDVENLAKKGVFALRVHSAEALYYCSAAIAAVAHRQAESLGQDVEALLSSASQQAIDALKQDDLAERMAARRCERRIRELILSQIPGWKSIKDETARKVNVSVDSPYPKEFTRFKNLVDNGDLDQLLALYPLRESGALDVIAKALQCGSRSNYEQIVLSRIRANEDLAQHLKIRIGALSEALHELPQHAAPI